MYNYASLYDQIQLPPAIYQQALSVAKFIINEPRYKEVEKLTGVSSHLIGVIHYREGSFDFTTHLHNGDSLKRRTVNVPAGRPKGKPPFKWVTSAVDAVKLDNLTTSKQFRDMCQASVLYNGLGYENHGVNSPYGFAATQFYTRGMYIADGRYSSTAKDSRLGTCTILVALEKLEKERLNLPPVLMAGSSKPKLPVDQTILGEYIEHDEEGTVFTQPNPNLKISHYFTAGNFSHNGTRTFFSLRNFAACKRLAIALDGVQDYYGIDKHKMTIISGIRSQETNSRVGGAKNSYHLSNNEKCAADFTVKGTDNRVVYSHFKDTWLGGLGQYRAGTSTHMDLGESYVIDDLGNVNIERKSRRWDWTNK